MGPEVPKLYICTVAQQVIAVQITSRVVIAEANSALYVFTPRLSAVSED